MARTLRMEEKELMEARRAGIHESIVSMMKMGMELSEREKDIINQFGKVYVEAHKKDGKWIKPYLRDLPEDHYYRKTGLV